MPDTEDGELQILAFQARGENKSNDTLSDISGYVESLITGERCDVFLVVDGVAVPPEQTSGIPAHAQFDVSAPFHHDEKRIGDAFISVKKFKSTIGAFKFIITYGNKKEFSKVFNQNDIDTEITRVTNRLISAASTTSNRTPRVTRKSH